MVKGHLPGCGLHGYSFVSIFFQQSMQCSLYKYGCLYDVCFCVLQVSSVGVYASSVSLVVSSVGVYASSVSLMVSSVGVYASSVSLMVSSVGVYAYSVSLMVRSVGVYASNVSRGDYT